MSDFLSNGFFFVYIPFGNMLSSLFIELVPVDFLSHGVVFCLIHLLRWIAEFTFYGINFFISFSHITYSMRDFDTSVS